MSDRPFEPTTAQIDWARNFLGMVRNGSRWEVPSTGQVYTIDHNAKTLTLTEGPVDDALGWHEKNKALFAAVGYQVLDGKSGDIITRQEAVALVDELLNESPNLKTLKAARRSLSPEERQQAGDAMVWKAVVNGKTWFVCNTHRAFAAKSTLPGAIRAWNDEIEQTG